MQGLHQDMMGQRFPGRGACRGWRCAEGLACDPEPTTVDNELGVFHRDLLLGQEWQGVPGDVPRRPPPKRRPATGKQLAHPRLFGSMGEKNACYGRMLA